MILLQIILKNFRNLEEKDFSFSPSLTLIVGENAEGKTNLLEAIHFICNGTGFRETKENELVNLNKNSATVEAKFKIDNITLNFKISLRKKELLMEKVFFINKARKRNFDYRKDSAFAVLFAPQQIEILTDSPDIRRKYLDRLISFFDFEYKKRLANYESALRKRNKLLEILGDINKLKEELLFWDDYLEEQADYITAKRSAYIDFLNSYPDLENKHFRIEYLKNEISKQRFDEVFEKELILRRTLIGPQKDDFKIYLKDKNLHSYGSRSEQRLAIFWLKINEINFYEQNFKSKPILLLDDIFSELDEKNKKLVFDLIKKYQTILTMTETEMIHLPHAHQTLIKL